MAKSDSFFIRATVSDNGTTFNEASIDLGFAVDALGKSVLRIHNIAHRWTVANDGTPFPGAASVGAANWQLTTQPQTAIVAMTDKSLISSGHLDVQANAAGEVVLLDDTVDLSPQQFTNGYLVGVETIYLGFDQSIATMCDGAQVILECTVETLSTSAAMALSLSQQ